LAVLALVTYKNRKSSSHSEGSMGSRKVSFIDELTGKSARPGKFLFQKLTLGYKKNMFLFYILL